ncbi:MAG: SIMPL domain-containing protein [Bacilli bacterium]|nr:SIMPL domain-containing protein [Bacilli bacterium]
MPEKTLIITGKATKSFAPDTIRVSIEHKRIFESYDEAVIHLTKRTKETRDRVIQAGLDGEALKTCHFEVEPHYKRYRDPKGEYREELIGYRAFIRFEVDFCFDSKNLSSFLSSVRETKDSVSFSYRLSNPEGAKEEVMALATEAAIKKAKIIAKTASISLGDILNIDYSVKKDCFQFQRFEMLGCDCCSAPETQEPEIDITPNDLTVSDSVTLVYAIK